MKWWVWLIVGVLVVSGVFWLYVFLSSDKKKNEQLERARLAKAMKAAEAEVQKESETVLNAGLT